VKEKKDPAILEDFFSFSFSSPSTVIRAFSWPIKEKARRAMKGDSNPSNPEPIRTHKHIAEK